MLKSFIIEKIIYIFRKISIFQRLIIGFLTLIIIPMVFITFFTYNQYVKEIEKNTEKFLTILIDNISDHMLNKLEEIEGIAVNVYADDDIIHKLTDNSNGIVDEASTTINIKLHDYGNNNNYILGMGIITENNNYYMKDKYGQKRGASIKKRQDFINSKYYEEAVNQHGYPVWFDTTKVSNLFYKRDNEIYGITEYITMTQAIYSTDHKELLGVLYINVDADYLTNSFKSYLFYGEGNTLILSEQGIITGFNYSIFAPNLTIIPDFEEKVLSKKDNIWKGKIENVNLFLVYKKIPYSEMYITHIVDMDTLLRNAYKIRNLCLILVLCLIIVSAIVLFLTTISISQPINQLIKVVKQTPKDRFKEKYEVTGNDEITVLGKRYNQMIEHTQTLINQIYLSEINKKNLEISRSKAELNALQMQINPHFLYNTMDMIRWQAMYETGGENKVTHMIDDFCKLMRISINSNSDMNYISDEIEYAKAYIDVINFRHEHKIKINTHFDFDTKKYVIPKLTFQPILENSIKHGYNQAKDFGIIINGIIKEKTIVIEIIDNGKGMEKDVLNRLNENFSDEEAINKSIGLQNVNRRLKLYYGHDFGLIIESENSKGTKVVITLLPKIIADHIEGERNDL